MYNPGETDMRRVPVYSPIIAMLLSCLAMTGCAPGSDKVQSGDEEDKPANESIVQSPGTEHKTNPENRQLFPVKVKGRWGYMDLGGNLVIEPQFEDAWKFSEGVAPVEKNGRYGYITLKGEWAIEPEFTFADGINEGLAVVVESGGFGYIDRKGEKIVPCEWDRAYEYSCGRGLCVQEFGKNAIFNGNGEIVRYVDGEFFTGFSGDMLPFVKSGRGSPPLMGYFDMTGSMVLEPVYREVAPFSEGLAAVRFNHHDRLWKYFYINRDGETVIDHGLSGAGDFSNGLAAAGVPVLSGGSLSGSNLPREWGYIETLGQWRIPARFARAYPFGEDRAVTMTHGGVMEVIDSRGKVVGRPDIFPVSIDWERYNPRKPQPKFENGLCMLRIAPSIAVINPEGDVLDLQILEIPRQNRALTPSDESGDTYHRPVLDGRNRRWIAVPGMSTQSRFDEGIFTARVSTRFMAALIDAEGKILFQGDIREGFPVEDYSNPLLVREQDLFGYIDSSGSWLIGPAFHNARSFSEGIAAVADSNGNWGFVDESGAWIREPEFNIVRDFHEGRAAVRGGSKWGFINKEGRMVVQPQFHETLDFSGGLCAVKTARNWGFISTKGIMLIEPRFEEARSFSDGLAAVRSGKKYGFIDRLGRIILEPEWDSCEDFSEGLAVVRRRPDSDMPWYDNDGDFHPSWEFRVIDRNGKTVFDCPYQEIESFHEGRARVLVNKEGGKFYEYVNTKGELVTDLKLADAGDFLNGMAMVTLPERIAYIDRNGAVVWPPTY
jgi:hypothetical protein